VRSTVSASTSCRIATAVNILFIDPIRKRPDRVRDLPFAIGEPVRLGEQHLAALGDQHRAAEPVRRGLLTSEDLECCQGLRLGQPMKDQIEGARWLRRIEELDPSIGARTDGFEPDVVHAGAQRSLVVALRETKTHRLARPRRKIHAHRGRRDLVGSPSEVRKTLSSTSSSATESIGAEWIDEVDPELLVRLG
jgi:hypothetical protein